MLCLRHAATRLGADGHAGVGALGVFGKFQQCVAVLIQLQADLAEEFSELVGSPPRPIHVGSLHALVEALRGLTDGGNTCLQHGTQTIENELQAMGAEERSKQAIAMLATGVYMNSGVKGGGLSMGSALNSVIQSQINSLAGSAFQSINASFTMGMEDRTSAETGDKQTDYSFRYSQRLFNDRVQIVIGGKVTTGANATNDAGSFEYRLDTSGTRYVRVFYDKNYESVLDGEITETGVGLVLRRKMDRLGELFTFRKKKKQTVE